MSRTLHQIPWVNPNMNKVIEGNGYVNHIVLERENKFMQGHPQWQWQSRTSSGAFQIGFSLSKSVRVDPLDDGTPALQGPIDYLNGVISLLEGTYNAKRVTRYMNPEHKDVEVVQKEDVGPRTLFSLTTLSQRQRRRGQSRSEAKISAARERMAEINRDRILEAEERGEKYLALRKGGLKEREIAERDGISLNAVRNVLKRARKAQRVKAEHEEKLQAQWRERLEQGKSRRRITDEQQAMIEQYGDPTTYHEDGSFTIEFNGGDSVRVRR